MSAMPSPRKASKRNACSTSHGVAQEPLLLVRVSARAGRTCIGDQGVCRQVLDNGEGDREWGGVSTAEALSSLDSFLRWARRSDGACLGVSAAAFLGEWGA